MALIEVEIGTIEEGDAMIEMTVGTIGILGEDDMISLLLLAKEALGAVSTARGLSLLEHC